MTVEIPLHLPDELIEQARPIASVTQRDVEAVLSSD
jgi:hypothetical protein